jgi:hypothetical protein
VVDSLKEQRPTWNWRLNRITYLRDGKSCDMELTGEVAAMTPAEREAYLQDQEQTLDQHVAEPALLRPDDLKKIDSDLVEWGSHSLTHTNLGCCDLATARTELAESVVQLQAWTGRPIRYFSYPNGSYNAAVARLAEECGYEASLAVGQLDVAPATSPFAIPRFDIWPVSAGRLRWEVCGALTRLRGARQQIRLLRGQLGLSPRMAPEPVVLSRGTDSAAKTDHETC